MQIISAGDDLHELSSHIFLEKKKTEKNQICLSSAGSICSALWDKEWWYPDRQDKTDGVTLNLGSNPITFPEALIWRQETG